MVIENQSKVNQVFFPGASPGLVNCATTAILLRLPDLRVFER
jgi:hypothetical protein